MMPEQKVTAVILNYNGAEDTLACLNSLLDTNYKDLDIVIVDNSSPDNSFAVLAEFLSSNNLEHNIFLSPAEAMNKNMASHAKFTLIQSCENKGYGHGNNIGIRFAINNHSDFVLVLNNDTIVTRDFLQPVVNACIENNNIGIASGKIYFLNEPDRLWYAGGKFSPFSADVKHYYFNQKDTGQKIPEDINFISGCFWLIPSATFAKVGFINEEYFMYIEDLEFCYRVQKQGLTLKVCEESKIFHKTSSSSGGRFSAFSVYWRARNKVRFILEYYSFPMSLLAIVYSQLYVLARLSYLGKVNLIPAHLKGMMAGFANYNKRD